MSELTIDEVNRDYLTVSEAIRTIKNTTRQRYDQKVKRGEVRSVKVGPYLLVHRGDVERWHAGSAPWFDALHADDYVTIQEAAAELGITRDTLLQQERNGAIAMERRDGRIVVSREQVEMYRTQHLGKNALKGPEGDAIRAMGLAAQRRSAAMRGTT